MRATGLLYTSGARAPALPHPAFPLVELPAQRAYRDHPPTAPAGRVPRAAGVSRPPTDRTRWSSSPRSGRIETTHRPHPLVEFPAQRAYRDHPPTAPAGRVPRAAGVSRPPTDRTRWSSSPRSGRIETTHRPHPLVELPAQRAYRDPPPTAPAGRVARAAGVSRPPTDRTCWSSCPRSGRIETPLHKPPRSHQTTALGVPGHPHTRRPRPFQSKPLHKPPRSHQTTALGVPGHPRARRARPFQSKPLHKPPRSHQTTALDVPGHPHTRRPRRFQSKPLHKPPRSHQTTALDVPGHPHTRRPRPFQSKPLHKPPRSHQTTALGVPATPARAERAPSSQNRAQKLSTIAEAAGKRSPVSELSNYEYSG
ncbi:hypothetical protein FB389_0216 [Rarobacter incanus]|uniref:Uncharacterized protein n=1 Tax=Rarobacter incanus TaxID=153494 RepID=A0A542SLT1_9MICO|nr:hypothetical protein FB389_0216 [Rarobacter incanus]